MRSCGRAFQKAGQLMKKIKAVFREKSGFRRLFPGIADQTAGDPGDLRLFPGGAYPAGREKHRDAAVCPARQGRLCFGVS